MTYLPSLPSYPIRASARALIVQDGKVLLSKFDDENGPHYNWPGGGMEFGELIQDTVKREVMEETSAEVEVGDLFCVFEHLVEESEAQDGMPQTLSLIFHCVLKNGSVPELPENPDPFQVAVEWIPIDELQEHWVLPDLTALLQRWWQDGKSLGEIPFCCDH